MSHLDIHKMQNLSKKQIEVQTTLSSFQKSTQESLQPRVLVVTASQSISSQNSLAEKSTETQAGEPTHHYISTMNNFFGAKRTV